MDASSSMTNKEETKSAQANPHKGEKVLVIDSDMEDDMQKSAIEVANSFLKEDPQRNDAEIAKLIKNEFESRYYPTWNCIIGKSFGLKINAQKRHYMCFQIGSRTIILYKFR
ncbi:MAG: dynein light chain family protein [archaeon]|nr:dynein light chain family protein [archaeon]